MATLGTWMAASHMFPFLRNLTHYVILNLKQPSRENGLVGLITMNSEND